MAPQAAGRWELVKVNIEQHQDLAAAHKIASIPAVKLFVNGKVADEFVGALPEREFRNFIERALPSPSTKQMAEAQRFLSEGTYSPAAELLESIVGSEPANLEARILLAQALLRSNPKRATALLETMGLDSEFPEEAHAVRTLARFAELVDHPAGLPEAKVRERYLPGATAVRCGDYETALEAFIEVLKRDNQYAQGGAKEACKAIFQLLGMRHTLVERSSRAFGSALHS